MEYSPKIIYLPEINFNDYNIGSFPNYTEFSRNHLDGQWASGGAAYTFKPSTLVNS